MEALAGVESLTGYVQRALREDNGHRPFVARESTRLLAKAVGDAQGTREERPGGRI